MRELEEAKARELLEVKEQAAALEAEMQACLREAAAAHAALEVCACARVCVGVCGCGRVCVRTCVCVLAYAHSRAHARRRAVGRRGLVRSRITSDGLDPVGPAISPLWGLKCFLCGACDLNANP